MSEPEQSAGLSGHKHERGSGSAYPTPAKTTKIDATAPAGMRFNSLLLWNCLTRLFDVITGSQSAVITPQQQQPPTTFQPAALGTFVFFLVDVL